MDRHGMLRVLYDPVAGGADALAADGAIARGRQEKDIFATLVAGAVAALVAIVLRSVTIVVVTKAFHLEYLREAVQRSVTEMLAGCCSRGFRELATIPQEDLCAVWCVCLCVSADPDFYIISGCDPCGDAGAIRGRDLWALLLLPAAYLAAFSLFIEGKATLYRSAQFLPVFCGYGALLFVYGIWQLTGTMSSKAKNTAGRKISAGGGHLQFWCWRRSSGTSVWI